MEKPEMQPLTWKDRWIILGMLAGVALFWVLLVLVLYLTVLARVPVENVFSH